MEPSCSFCCRKFWALSQLGSQTDQSSLSKMTLKRLLWHGCPCEESVEDGQVKSCGSSEELCLRRNLYLGSEREIERQMVEGEFEVFLGWVFFSRASRSHLQKTRGRRIWEGAGIHHCVLLESHLMSLNFNTVMYGHSPHFGPTSSPTGLCIRGGDNRYST